MDPYLAQSIDWIKSASVTDKCNYLRELFSALQTPKDIHDVQSLAHNRLKKIKAKIAQNGSGSAATPQDRQINTTIKQEIASIDVNDIDIVHDCQRCLKTERAYTTVWISCDGGCRRWFHHSCVPELSDIKQNIKENVANIKWFCPICQIYGPFKDRKQ